MIPAKPFLLIVGALTVATGWTQSVSTETYDFNFIGQPLPDPVLQHSKETFVLFGCAYCHGLNLVELSFARVYPKPRSSLLCPNFLI
jgi:hypothetical protein